MKQKPVLGITLIILMIMSSNANCWAQNIVVREKSGLESPTELLSLRKITFRDQEFILNYWTGLTETYPISDINTIFFTGTGNSLSTPASGTLSLYPNPVTHSIYLKNIPLGENRVSIFRIDGTQMMQFLLMPGENSVAVDHLQSGLYILSLNQKTFKFIKQ